MLHELLDLGLQFLIHHSLEVVLLLRVVQATIALLLDVDAAKVGCVLSDIRSVVLQSH